MVFHGYTQGCELGLDPLQTSSEQLHGAALREDEKVPVTWRCICWQPEIMNQKSEAAAPKSSRVLLRCQLVCLLLIRSLLLWNIAAVLLLCPVPSSSGSRGLHRPPPRWACFCRHHPSRLRPTSPPCHIAQLSSSCKYLWPSGPRRALLPDMHLLERCGPVAIYSLPLGPSVHRLASLTLCLALLLTWYRRDHPSALTPGFLASKLQNCILNTISP